MSFPNLLQGVNQGIGDIAWRQSLNGVVQHMENLKSCCFFFDLKLGCKLIALFEALSGLWQIYHGYKELYVHKDRLLAPEWIDTKVAQHSAQFKFFLALVGFFSAQLLLAGVIFERKMCVLLWIYVTALCTLICMFYTLVIDCIPELLLFDVFSAGLEAYFIVTALAYYMQMRRVEHTDDDFEVLFTASEV
ncbi:uncharacterized protein LOC115760490 isoform X1 [Drosophila novamexicana]|uniref:uncharacterized protein LOC115760490 isoform X1 n=1 Tax=Drosophila novamexicana TaxID=47314 RepID=UPI0011E5A485|nr:uncharacterized protein LOC115760490 isoform X1 [Drosophila novamexicana]